MLYHDSITCCWLVGLLVSLIPLAFSAFLGIFCNQLASLLGIQLVGAVMASLVHLATPMFAMGIAVYLGQEKLNAFLAAGVVVDGPWKMPVGMGQTP